MSEINLDDDDDDTVKWTNIRFRFRFRLSIVYTLVTSGKTLTVTM